MHRPVATRRHARPRHGEHVGAVIDADAALEARGVAQQHLSGAAAEIQHRVALRDAAVEPGEQEVVRELTRLRVDVVVDRRRLAVEFDVVGEVFLPAFVHGARLERWGSAMVVQRT